MTRPCAFLGTAALVALLATPAQATPIVEQTLVATGGDVVVTFVSNARLRERAVSRWPAGR
jgi:hypothetical protein